MMRKHRLKLIDPYWKCLRTENIQDFLHIRQALDASKTEIKQVIY